jgi:hypothetical protein
MVAAMGAACALGACTSIWAVDEDGNARNAPAPSNARAPATETVSEPEPYALPAPAPRAPAQTQLPGQAASPLTTPSAAPGISIAQPAPETAETQTESAEAAQTEPTITGTGTRSDPNSVVVRGVAERPVPPPDTDPRSTSERMADIRAWDQCVMRIQNTSESDPLRPMLDTPEEVCRVRLGMASRQSIPDSRRDNP